MCQKETTANVRFARTNQTKITARSDLDEQSAGEAHREYAHSLFQVRLDHLQYHVQVPLALF